MTKSATTVPAYARTKYSPEQVAHQQMLKRRAGQVPDRRKEASRRAARGNSAGRYTD